MGVDTWTQVLPLRNIPLVVLVVVSMVVIVAAVTTLAVRLTSPPYRYLVHGAGKVIVSEVSSEELRGSATTPKRHAYGAPAVRSVDILPAAEMMAMHASTPTPSAAIPTVSAPTVPTPTIPTPAIPTTTIPTPTIPSSPMTNPTMPKEHSQHHANRWPRVRWSSSGYFVAVAAMLAICSTTAHAVDATAGYIVLVGLPVLDRVLPLKNLAQELLQRGFHVGLALPEHCRHWVADLDHLEFISLGHFLTTRAPNDVTVDLDSAAIYDSYGATLRYYATFQRPTYTALLDDFDEDRPELVIVDRYAFGGVDACHKLAIPYVVHSPSLLLDVDAPPAYVPAPLSSFIMHNPSVLARCQNGWHRLRFRLAMVPVFRDVNHARTEHGLAPIQSKHDLYGQHLVLVSSMIGLDAPRPLAPQFQLIGMLEPTRPTTKQLSSELEQWIARDSVKPLVLICFTSDTPLSPDVVTMLLNGLEHIGARLVWKIALEEQAAFDLGARPRDSVFFMREDDTMMDEMLVLQHAPVSLLITPGHHYSVLQALALGVPVLGIPFTAEQWETMNMVSRTGAGILLQQTTLSDERVHDAALALLYKSRYAAAAFHVGEILKTGGGTKRAADAVQSVLEFGPAHVLPARNTLPLYRAYLVDVYAVYGLILFCSAIVLRSCFAALYHILQLAPDVHLGVTLDDDDMGDDVANGASDGHHHEVHKSASGHHQHDHAHHAHGKEKHV